MANHDFNAALEELGSLNLWPSFSKEMGAVTTNYLLQNKKTIQTALRLADRLQRGDVSEEMDQIGRETLLKYGNGTQEMFQAMAAQLLKEVDDER